MKHKIILFLAAICLLFGCTKNETQKPVTMVFLPNESSDAMKDARQAFMEIISEAIGRPVEIKTTTDYNIALEAIISGNADMAYIGAEGYIKKSGHYTCGYQFRAERYIGRRFVL